MRRGAEPGHGHRARSRGSLRTAAVRAADGGFHTAPGICLEVQLGRPEGSGKRRRDAAGRGRPLHRPVIHPGIERRGESRLLDPGRHHFSDRTAIEIEPLISAPAAVDEVSQLAVMMGIPARHALDALWSPGVAGTGLFTRLPQDPPSGSSLSSAREVRQHHDRATVLGRCQRVRKAKIRRHQGTADAMGQRGIHAVVDRPVERQRQMDHIT